MVAMQKKAIQKRDSDFMEKKNAEEEARKAREAKRQQLLIERQEAASKRREAKFKESIRLKLEKQRLAEEKKEQERAARAAKLAAFEREQMLRKMTDQQREDFLAKEEADRLALEAQKEIERIAKETREEAERLAAEEAKKAEEEQRMKEEEEARNKQKFAEEQARIKELKQNKTWVERKTEAWVLDSNRKECHACKGPFKVTFRRHHCRVCGDIFCDDCSPKLVYKGVQIRMCKPCLQDETFLPTNGSSCVIL